MKSSFRSDPQKAHICPIFKKHDTEDPNNYRPITAALFKVFEKVIALKKIENKLDFSKTFDSLSHEILLKKRETLHFDQNLVSLT